MNEDRGHWYLLTGLVIGLVLGLIYAWVFQPVEYIDTSPASLREDFKDKYRALIASAYVANGDLVRARARLELLGDSDVYRVLAEQAQRTLAEEGPAEEARALGLLAIALGQEAPGLAVANTQTRGIPTISVTITTTPTATSIVTLTPNPTSTPPPTPTPTSTFTSVPTTTEPQITAQTPESPTPSISPTLETQGTPTETPIPRPTDTPAPTPTPTSTPGGPFVLTSRDKVCDQELAQPLIYVQASNALGQPVPGVEVIVTWESGEERFFTGLKPELGLGYADFTPLPGIVYTLRLGEGGKPVLDLAAVECQDQEGERFWGAWQLEFVQP